MVFKDDYPIPVVHSEKETKKPERTLCRRQFFFSFFFFCKGLRNMLYCDCAGLRLFHAFS